jgi:hypothetical protein
MVENLIDSYASRPQCVLNLSSDKRASARFRMLKRASEHATCTPSFARKAKGRKKTACVRPPTSDAAKTSPNVRSRVADSAVFRERCQLPGRGAVLGRAVLMLRYQRAASQPAAWSKLLHQSILTLKRVHATYMIHGNIRAHL